MTKIPFVSVYGDRHSCGFQVGNFYKDLIAEYINDCRTQPPKDLSWSECLDKSKEYLEFTQKNFPQAIVELQGVAQGSGVDFLDIFTSCVEEFYSPFLDKKGCTDIVILPPRNNRTLVLHTNDLSLSIAKYIVSVEWNIHGLPVQYAVGVGGYSISAGVNNTGLVLSGNELVPNDVRVGVPRSIIAREIICAKNLEEAVDMANNPDRASSYNNIVTVKGKSVSIEGSATASQILESINGVLCHSNHYIGSQMISFEGEPNYQSSILRLKSAIALTRKLQYPLNLTDIEKSLSDHTLTQPASNDSICRHGPVSSTLFSLAVDLDGGIVDVCVGNPCQNSFYTSWRFKTAA